MSGARSSRSDAEDLEAHYPSDALLRSILTSRRLQLQPSVVHGRCRTVQHALSNTHYFTTRKAEKSQPARNFWHLSIAAPQSSEEAVLHEGQQSGSLAARKNQKSLKDTVYAVNTLVFRRSGPGRCAFRPRAAREGPPEAYWRN